MIYRKLKEVAKEIYVGINVKNYLDKAEISQNDSEKKIILHIPIINISNLTEDGFFVGDFKRLKIFSQREILKYTVKEKDVIFNSRGTTLKIAIVDEERAGYLITSNMIAVSLIDEFITPEIFEFYLRSEKGFYELMKLSFSSKNSIRLTKESVEELKVPILKPQELASLSGLLNDYKIIKNIAKNISTDLDKMAYFIMKILNKDEK
ncbi:MAG: restriction endonuclease subunit S [candidate division WOR-3 bacterium]